MSPPLRNLTQAIRGSPQGKALKARFLRSEAQQLDYAGTETTARRKEVTGKLRVKVKDWEQGLIAQKADYCAWTFRKQGNHCKGGKYMFFCPFQFFWLV